MLQVGDIVKFHTPNEDEDADQTYIILDYDLERCLIQACGEGYFQPTYSVNTSDLIKA